MRLMGEIDLARLLADCILFVIAVAALAGMLATLTVVAVAMGAI